MPRGEGEVWAGAEAADADVAADVEGDRGAEEEAHRPSTGTNETAAGNRAPLFVEEGQQTAPRVRTRRARRLMKGATPRAVAAVREEEIPGGTTALPDPRGIIIGHRRRRLGGGPRVQAAVEADIAPARDPRRRGETTGSARDPPRPTDPTRGSGRALLHPRRTTALPIPAVRVRPFQFRRTDPPRVVATMEGVIRGALLRRRGLMGSTEETIGNQEERGRSRCF